jgi:GT2 family glycosyltransferase
VPEESLSRRSRNDLQAAQGSYNFFIPQTMMESPADQNKPWCTDEMSRPRVLIVVVLYKMQSAESQTMQGLLDSFAGSPELRDSFRVLIWDNSPTPLQNPQPLSSFLYKHSPENVGVSGAYNRAMKIAEDIGCQWLLLLDQDTDIPTDFLPRALKLACRFSHQPAIAAVVPFLMEGDRVLSPLKVVFKRFKPLHQPFEGIYPGQVTAANSGALIRISALQEIGGFREDFWLDFSDVVVFHLLHQHGKQVYIAGDLLLKHKITVIDFENSVSPQRYASMIAAEGAYWDTYGTAAERAFHALRILDRALRHKRRFHNSAFAKIVLAEFFRRLFLTRKQRLRRWKLQSRHRDIPRHPSAAGDRE